MKASWATELVPILLATAALIGQGTSAAQAQSPVTYVSQFGNDDNSCNGVLSPCKTFNGAQIRVAEGGTITCLNPSYYEFFTITKSITLDCQLAGGTPPSIGIVISASGKNVKLRNIALNNFGNNTVVDIISATSVHLENVFVTGATGGPGVGIYDRRTGPAKLFISDSNIVANSGPAIAITPQPGTFIAAVLDNVRLKDSNHGVVVGRGGRAMIKRSVLSGNLTTGVFADPEAFVQINDSLISYNPTGVFAQSGAQVVISNSDINSNNTAISGATRSHGNNRFFANVSDGTPPTPVGSPSNDNGQR